MCIHMRAHMHTFVTCAPMYAKTQSHVRYIVPRGWVGFGLKLPPRAETLQTEQWCVSFHGVSKMEVLHSILNCGQLMKAGDRLLDGTKLRSSKCAGRQDEVFYTSPTVKYAGLKFYAEPHLFDAEEEGGDLAASIVVQVRQKPGYFTTQGETMGFRRWPGYLEKWCPHTDLGGLEWKSDMNVGTIPYRVLVRVYPRDEAQLTPGERAPYSSPVD